jgi:hypothetical protein
MVEQAWVEGAVRTGSGRSRRIFFSVSASPRRSHPTPVRLVLVACFFCRRGRNGFPPRAEAGREQARPVNPAASACLAGVRLPFAMGSRRAWELNGSGSGVGCLLI